MSRSRSVAAHLLAVAVIGIVPLGGARAPRTNASRLCKAGAAVSVGTVTNPAITEASGLVASRAHPGRWYTHNDSGDSARVFAIDDAGATVGELAVPGAAAVDWEDIARGPVASGGADRIYVGDMGDNVHVRASIHVYSFDEPSDPAATIPAGSVHDLELRYPDGPHDAEALLVDPRSGELVIVTKEYLGPGAVYRVSLPPTPSGSLTLSKVGTVRLSAGQPVTGGDVSIKGDTALLRTYSSVWAFPRRKGEALSAALLRSPCAAPAPSEPQGEAVGLLPSGVGYRTISEGATPTLWQVSA